MYLLWFFGAVDAHLSLKFGFGMFSNVAVKPYGVVVLFLLILMEVGITILLFRKYFTTNKNKNERRI